MIAQSSDRQRDHWIVAKLEIKTNAGFYIHVKLGLKKYPKKTNMQRLSIPMETKKFTIEVGEISKRSSRTEYLQRSHKSNNGSSISKKPCIEHPMMSSEAFR